MDITVDRSRLLHHLGQLLRAHAPSGQESEVDALVSTLLGSKGGAVQRDRAGSLVLHIAGDRGAPAVAVAAHMDEICLIVKRVEKEGRLRVQPVGGLHPWAVGETPVEILTDGDPVPGVLSIGAKHVSRESPAGQLKDGAGLTWEQMWVETKLDEATLQAAGVRVGRRAVIARPHKSPWFVGAGQFVCGHNLDCRGGLAILAEVALQLADHPPAGDVFLVASTEEEIGGHGALYSVGQLPVDTLLAVDVAPVAEEYQTRNSAEPVLLCKDSTGLYHQGTVDQLVRLAGKLGFGVQLAVVTSYGSDASIARARGAVARAALLGYPGDNTHGFEICHVDGLVNTARLLLAYLWQPGM
ncbi:MAG: M20/M25/M40 family metallo-hydrolase [Candidatus Latescibacterota bacterium]